MTSANEEIEQGPALQFKEKMKGFAKMGESDYEAGERDGTPLTVRVTVRTEGIDFFLLDPKHRGTAGGYVCYEAAGNGRIPIESGEVSVELVHAPSMSPSTVNETRVRERMS